MRIVTSTAQMQRHALAWRRKGVRVAFVPTMGFLHEGHLSLVRRARKLARARGVVVASIYVNPTQFAPHEDLAKYPRDFGRDRQLCRQNGVDAIFLPDDEQMYPGRSTGDYSTYVVEESLTRGMEGAARPAHFRGVTTIVAKLFNVVLPDAAVFGAKDFQQAVVVQRMTRDLNFPVRIVVVPTHREPDGLAMSSRNKYLNPAQRRQALVLWQSIQYARAVVRGAKRPVPAARLKKGLRRLIEREPEARVDYVEVFDPATLRPVSRVSHGTQLALAVFVGPTRLIDNARL
ncbi:MAG: pantoate--beta-alanine ligase [Verrucomicrobia bacterium]|nr:pantoate--beta-alanine ligase [Verrucomicrobiota bacterium]